MRQGFESNFSKPIFTFPEIHWVVFYWQCDRNGVSGESQIRIGFQRNIRPQLLKSFQTHPNHEVEIKSSQKLKAENQNSDQIRTEYSNKSVSIYGYQDVFCTHLRLSSIYQGPKFAVL